MIYRSPSDERFVEFENELLRLKKSFQELYNSVHGRPFSAEFDLLLDSKKYRELHIWSASIEAIIYYELLDAVEILDYETAIRLANYLKKHPTEEDAKKDALASKIIRAYKRKILNPLPSFSMTSINHKPRLQVAELKLPSTRIDLFDGFESLNFLETYCEQFNTEPRHSAVSAVMETINSSFTQKLHEKIFNPETFQKINNKLKPTFSSIGDLALFRRNLIFIAAYSNYANVNLKFGQEQIVGLLTTWLKWLTSDISFKHIPVCRFMNKSFTKFLNTAELESVNYLIHITKKALQSTRTQDTKKFFQHLSNRFNKHLKSQKVKVYRTKKIASFLPSDKEYVAFVYMLALSSFKNQVDELFTESVFQILDEEGIDSHYFQLIESEMRMANLV